MSISAWLLTSSLVIIPSIFYFSWPIPGTPALATNLRSYISALLALHSLFIVYQFLLGSPPQNIFTALDIPLTTPSQKIRSVLLQYAGPPSYRLPQELENLLTKLSSFDIRNLYIRFGHETIQNCDYCQSFSDFALFALPGPLIAYVRTALLVGLITMRGTDRERWRLWGTGAVVAAAVFEVWWLCTVHIRIPNDGLGVVMWHDMLHVARQVFILLFPILLHFLPPSPSMNSPSSGPLESLIPATLALESTWNKVRLLEYTRIATLRSDQLRQNTQDWWIKEKMESEWGRRDSTLRDEANTVGMGFDTGESGQGEVGQLRKSARKIVDTLSHLWRFTGAEPNAT